MIKVRDRIRMRMKNFEKGYRTTMRRLNLDEEVEHAREV